LTVIERRPTLFDYVAGAILMNGLATMALYVAVYLSLIEFLLIPLWFLAAGVSAYLVCRRTTKQHLMVGIKTAVLSIVVGVVMLPTFGSLELPQIVMVLICYLVGSFGGAYYALKQQMRMEKPTNATPFKVEP